MSRKASHKAEKPAAKQVTEDDLQLQAEQHFERGRFKESIELLKDLRKRKPGAAQDLLLQAYQGRCQALADKGMFQEAVALWRVRCSTCQAPLATPEYVYWLMQAGAQGEALGLLAKMADTLAAAERVKLEAALAAHVLFLPAEALAKLPVTLGLVRDRPAAHGAVAAYAAGEWAALEQHLQQIGFRSPYRDLALALKALVSKDDQVRALPAGSPFYPLMRVAQAARLEGEALFQALLDLGANERAAVLTLKGVSSSSVARTREVLALKDAKPLQLTGFILRHANAFAAGWAKHLLQQLLPHGACNLRELKPIAMGDEAQIMLVMAQARAEKLQGYQDIESWQTAIAWMKTQPAHQRDAAEIILHIVEEAASDFGSDANQLTDLQLPALREALELAPDNLDILLRLVDTHLQLRQLKPARELIDAAVERHPEHPAVLQSAVSVALAGESFKKAASLARRALALDPINHVLRRQIVNAQRAHACKQIKNGRADLALAELNAAAEWARGPDSAADIAILRAMANQLVDSRHDLFQMAGGDLAAAFRLTLAAASCGAKPAAWLAGVGLPKRAQAKDVVALTALLDQLPRQQAVIEAALSPLTKYLEKTVTPELTLQSWVALIHALTRHHAFSLAQHLIIRGLRHWHEAPALVYLQLSMIYGTQPSDLSKADFHRLVAAEKRAKGERDQITAARIGAMLDAYEEDNMLPMPAGLNISMVKEVLEEALRVMGNTAFVSMAESQLGKEVVNMIRAEVGNHKLAQTLIEYMQTVAAKNHAVLPPTTMPPTAPHKPAPKAKPTNPNQLSLFDDE